MLSRFTKHAINKEDATVLYLEWFVASVLDNPYLKNSSQIIEFLNSDRKTFIKRVNEMDKETSFKVG